MFLQKEKAFWNGDLNVDIFSWCAVVYRTIKQFKGAVTKKVGFPIWQKSFMEHIVRNRDDYEAITDYIIKNH